MPKPNLWVGSRTQSDSGATTTATAVVERLRVKPRLRRSGGCTDICSVPQSRDALSRIRGPRS